MTQLAREYGDKPAVIMGGSGVRVSYAELERQSNQIAQLFRSRGLRPGDHIAVLMENRPEFFPVVWAAQRSGLFYTPVNWHLSGAEAAYMVADCGARLLVASSDLEELGWSTLGDMGSVDADGYLYLADRRTDLILSGGVNIYPREVEDALALHPSVADIVVFGLPDEEMGQRVHAVVQPAVPGSGNPELAGENPKTFFMVESMFRPVPNGWPVSAGRMPLGWPVVPEE